MSEILLSPQRDAHGKLEFCSIVVCHEVKPSSMVLEAIMGPKTEKLYYMWYVILKHSSAPRKGWNRYSPSEESNYADYVYRNLAHLTGIRYVITPPKDEIK